MTSKPIALATLIGLFLFVGFVQPATAQTVFHYSYSSDTVLPDIQDQSPAGNDATAGPLAVLSADIPSTGVSPGMGNRSFDSSDPNALRANQAGAATTAVSLLDNDLIEAAGGYTYETWFKWNGGGAVNSIIDYAGTDKLVIDQRDAASTVLAMRMDPDDYAIGDAVAGQWHYVAFVFDSNGNSQVTDTITGNGTAYFDSLDPIPLGEMTKSAFGDSLVRSIGVGQHPIGFDLDYFDGSVFETRVSLGALGADQLLFVPEPATCATLALACLLLLPFARRR